MILPPPFAAAALLLAFVLPAQEPGSSEPAQPPAATEPVPDWTLLHRLKVRGCTLDDARVLVRLLVERPTLVRLQCTDALRAHVTDGQKRLLRDLEKATQRVSKTAEKLVRHRSSGAAATRIAELRAVIVGHARRPELTKDEIVRDSDPALAELGRLLLPEPEEFADADAALAAALDELRAQRDELPQWFELYVEATAGLELHRDAERHFQRHPHPEAPPTAAAVDDTIATARLLGLASSDRDRKALLTNAGFAGRMDAEELAGTAELNRIRLLLGLPLLRIDEKLSDCARDHSTDMHTLGFFSHTSPVDGKQSFGQRAARFGVSASSENIANGHADGQGAIHGWWHSPGHHRNMLGNHGRTGLGRHERMWTQLFGG
jgi:uncharacterized protein YkwD